MLKRCDFLIQIKKSHLVLQNKYLCFIFAKENKICELTKYSKDTKKRTNMRKILPISLVCMLAMPMLSNAENAKPLYSKVKAEESQAQVSSDAMYAYPAQLRNLGTNAMEDLPVCNLLTRHKSINEGAFLWAPIRETVLYKDMSANNPTSWLWNVPGAETTELTSQDAKVVYGKAGVYDMPTLTVETANGTSSFTPANEMTSAGGNQKIKVGGIGEITAADMREHGVTYTLGTREYDEGGYLGGTNSLDIVGWGNLYMVAQDECYLDGVNVYLYKKPTMFEEGATIKMQVWWPTITQNSITLTSYPIEGSYILMDEFKADGEDGAWALTYDGAVANVTFSEPLDLYGKPYFFISIEGFSNDPDTEDFILLSDITGKELSEVENANLLAHNSFARLNGENDYYRPISSYNGGTGSFMICPMIRSYAEDTSVKSIQGSKRGEFSVTRSGDNLKVFADDSVVVTLYDLSGKEVIKSNIENGSANIEMSSLEAGIYIASDGRGNTVKIVK